MKEKNNKLTKKKAIINILLTIIFTIYCLVVTTGNLILMYSFRSFMTFLIFSGLSIFGINGLITSIMEFPKEEIIKDKNCLQNAKDNFEKEINLLNDKKDIINNEMIINKINTDNTSKVENILNNNNYDTLIKSKTKVLKK